MKKTKPNVVFVLTDDQGYGDLGCHGNTIIETPNIDAHHADCVRFTDFHVGTTCAPTRSGLLTGHWCNSAGVWHTIGGRSLLRENEWTLADAFSEAGYRTGHFGKWHLGDSPPFRPHERGFDTSIYHAGGAIGNTCDPWGNDYFDDTYFVNGDPQKFEGYCTDVFFREGMRFIEENQDRPFLCYIATNAPHGPLNVEQSYIDIYKGKMSNSSRARFYAMISNIDENFGLLRAKLDALNLSDNTILVFMTDNGTASGIDLDENQYPIEGDGSYNAGMRGQKGSEYDGGHRVPFLIRYPDGNLSGGKDVEHITSYVDFMPTLLELCDIDVPPSRTFHGMSLVPLLRDGASSTPKRIIVSDTQRVARPIKWRKSSVMQQKWRLVNGKELYKTDDDPAQRNDISANHSDVVSDLRRGYDEWWDLVSKQFERDIPIALGSDLERVKITTHDIRNEECNTAFHHGQVRQGHICSGYWAVDVRSSGRYAIDIRRWPEEAGYPARSGIDGDDIEWRKDAIEARHSVNYSGGVAIPIEWARITIGGNSYEREVDDSDTGSVFEVDLETGEDQLYAAFYDRAERTIAPYYVYVTKQ